MASVELLKAARAKIADPANWTRFTLARNAKGVPVAPQSKKATCWCAHGALYAVGGVRGSVSENILYEAAGDTFLADPAEVNDNLGHIQVLMVFDIAIAKAEASNA